MTIIVGTIAAALIYAPIAVLFARVLRFAD